MSRLPDDELRDQLDRRLGAYPLHAAQRVELTEAIHARTRATARVPVGFARWRWLSAAAVVVALMVLVTVAYPRIAPPTASPSPSVPDPAGLTIYDAAGLAALVADPAAAGSVVLARVRLELHALILEPVTPTRCAPPRGCVSLVVVDEDVQIGVRGIDPETAVVPTETSLFAFRVLDDAVEYLGLASLANGDSPWTVPALLNSREAHLPNERLYAVVGWLGRTSGTECWPETEGRSDDRSEWWCATAVLLDDAVAAPDGHFIALRHAADEPAVDRVGLSPQSGIYLIGQGDCPTIADCPVWELVARLSMPGVDSPPPPQHAILSAEELADLVRSGAEEVVVAEAWIDWPLEPEPCNGVWAQPGGVGIACPTGVLGGVTPEIRVRRDDKLVPSASPPDELAQPKARAFRIWNRSLIYLGPVRPAADGLAWTVDRLRADPPPGEGASAELHVVKAWIVGSLDPPGCLWHHASSDPFLMCGSATWLTPAPYQPTVAGEVRLRIEPPTDGLRVQNDAYVYYAPQPAESEPKMKIPRQGTFVVRRVDCREQADECPLWELVARLGPSWEDEEPEPTPQPTPQPTLAPTAGPAITPAPTPLTGSAGLSFASAPPRWERVQLAGGAINGFEIKMCNGVKDGYPFEVGSAFMVTSAGQWLEPRNRAQSPYLGMPGLPEWLTNQDGWLTDWTMPLHTCRGGWVVYVTSGLAQPETIDWLGITLDVAPDRIGPPMNSVWPPAPPEILSDPLAVRPAAPYLEHDLEDWLRPYSIAPSVVESVLTEAKEMVKTVDGRPYWDTRVSIGCNSYNFCRLYIYGQSVGAAGYDTWSFVFQPDGSSVALEPWSDDGSEDPPWASVPAELIAELEAIVAADPDAVERLRPYSYGLATAAWYPDRPSVLSLTYSGPFESFAAGAMAEVGVRILTVYIDIEQGRVIEYRTGERYV